MPSLPRQPIRRTHLAGSFSDHVGQNESVRSVSENIAIVADNFYFGDFAAASRFQV